MVGVHRAGERLVGQIAKRQAITNPENTVYAVKRLIGRKFEDAEVAALRRARAVPRSSRPTTATPGCDVRGKRYSPAEISAMVLAKMKQTAEDYLGEPVTEAVVTVPAYFNDAQRQATKDARPHRRPRACCASSTSPPRPRSPTASTSRRPARARSVAVYDLGGGTFDISILELNEGVFEVKATNGDTFLGGEDFDQRLIDWLAKRFQEQTGIDLRRDRMALQRLKEAAERAKHELSSRDRDGGEPAVHHRRRAPARSTSPRRSIARRSRSW